nr:hypothetical protein [Streptomyces europaeiscabiei]
MSAIARGISDFSMPMDDIGTYLTGFFSGEVFVSRGGIIGQPWDALSPAYAAWKAKYFPGRPPLIRSGFLNTHFRHTATNNSVTIFNEAPYFDALQSGTRRMPARTMMAVDDMRQQTIVDIADQYVNSIVED